MTRSEQQAASEITETRTYKIETGFRSEFVLGASYIFKKYIPFLQNMNETYDDLAIPRKIVKCPETQFNLGREFFRLSRRNFSLYRR